MKDVPKLQITFYFFVVILFAYCLYLIIYSGEFLIGSGPSDDEMIFYVGFRILAGVFFFAAAYYLPRLNLNIKIIFTAGLIARVLLIPTNPVMEDDYNRYLWDGAITANAVNPYGDGQAAKRIARAIKNYERSI